VNFSTGGLADPVHSFSAASKESIHLGILALAVAGNEDALTFIDAAPPHVGDAKQKALLILERKINSYEKFNREFPGFGGFLPWFSVNDTGCAPLPDWANKVPGLDNGEMIWAMVAVQHSLEQYGPPGLAKRYEAYLRLLQKNVLTLFWAGDGNISAVTTILNVKVQPASGNYQFTGGWLDDPYEGELMAFWMDLYAPWPNQEERESIWPRKRAKLNSVVYNAGNMGRITVQEGFWFSSHEQWKYMELPYTDVPINKRVFLNGERARTWNSALLGIPGLYASVTDVRQGNGPLSYLSATGIQSIASQVVESNTTVTPYASFPVVLADLGVGLAWYRHMLAGPKMESQHGSLCSVNVSGTAVAPMMTWDAKCTTVLAILGGIAPINREVLKRDNTYARFYEIVNREWTAKFPTLMGESLPLAVPTVPIPAGRLPDFPDCTTKSCPSQ